MDTNLKNTKILYIITKSNWGGAQKYVFDLATSFAKQDATIAVACGGEGILKTRLEEAGINTYTIKKLERDVSLKKEIIAFFSLFQIIRQVKPDLIHLNSTKAGLLGVVVGRLCRVPKIIFTAHGWPFLEPRSRRWRFLTWLGSYLTALLSHQVIVVSENDLRHTKMPGLKDKLTMIHPAPDPFLPLPRQEARIKLYDEETIAAHERDIWLVTNAELNHNKNQSVVINAVAEFNSTHPTKIFYTLIGEGDDRDHLQEQIQLKGLNDEVRLLGYLPDSRVYLSAFDFFILPSRKEGLPYALLEAGQVRLPTLATNKGGIPELIIDRDTGLTIDVDNHETIVEALEQLVSNPNLREGIATNFQELVMREYNLPKMIEATTQVYRR